MKNLYYLKRNIEYRLLEFYELLTTYRKQIFIPVSLVLIGLSFLFQDWQRLKYIFFGFSVLFLVKRTFWEFPEMAYKYLFNKETPDIKKQRRFDNYTLPAMITIIILAIVVIIICAVSMAQSNGTYYPGWKSDINNMWANQAIQWVVDLLFPVKTHYSTLK